jgi:hypothetical protein
MTVSGWHGGDMANGDGKITLDSAIELVFNDAAKTISELKSRRWAATTLAVAGIIGIDTFGRGSNTRMPPEWATSFIALILVGYILLVWRCNTNLFTFKTRLKAIIRERFPIESLSLFKDQAEFSDAIVDEGTITGIECFLVGGAFVLALMDAWTKVLR